MTEFNFSEKYSIKRVLEINELISTYVGVKKENDDCFVIINEIHNRDYINLFLAEISDIDRSYFNDFIEYFIENGKLYTIFSYNTGTLIEKYILKEPLNLNHRLVLLKSILLKVYDNYKTPDFIKAFMLRKENIVVENNSVYLNYRMFCINGFDFKSDYEIYNSLELLINLLFSIEDRNSNTNINIILDKCINRLYKSLGEVIKDIDDALGYIEKEATLKEILLNKKKKLKDFSSKALVVGMLLIGFILVYRYIKNINEADSAYKNIDYIGTVVLGDNKEESNNASTVINVIEVSEDKKEDLPKEEVSPDTIIDNDNRINYGDKYVIRPNDSLYVICLEKYNDVAYILPLARYNNIPNPNLIYIGSNLSLPDRSVLDTLLNEENSLYKIGGYNGSFNNNGLDFLPIEENYN